MASTDNLPPPLSPSAITKLLTALSLPKPQSILPLLVTAAFHTIYLLTYPISCAGSLAPAETPDEGGETITLILRVSGDHLPRVKTLNEVAVLRWVRENTKIPVPSVVRWDAGTDNALGWEFMILERLRGESVDRFYDEVDEGVKMKLIQQMTDFVVELNSFEWNHVGGLEVDGSGKIVPGVMLEDHFWLKPDVEKYWNGRATIETLNPMKKFHSHEELVSGWLEAFAYAIEQHDTLTWLADLVPRLNALEQKLPNIKGLSGTKLLLAHKDLHFANIMALRDGTITGIIDWEFATVSPGHRWDPVRAFLWNGQENEKSLPEKNRLRSLWMKQLQAKGTPRWWEVGSEVQNVWEVISYTRALIEVCPKGERADKVKEWKRTAEAALTKLGL